ncbi:hypothetical protein OUZ56_003506 [Daphnia magna]|uniref:Uncharacterized protein n=1 Tax=Daphnia magna TaxID=35525 RepID=A0ABR0A9B9_9CRUS|nr:hypothetical protein OUZ56_003506 [Daphnia magna]
MAVTLQNAFRDFNHVVKFNGENYNEYKYELLSMLEQLGLKNMHEPVNGILNTCPFPIPAPIVIQPIDEQAENNPIIPQILGPANQRKIDAWQLPDDSID